MNKYEHTQRSPLHLLLYLPAIFAFVLAWQIRADAPPSIAVLGVALVLVVLSLSFQTLTVSDQGDRLELRYGPLNLFGTSIRYTNIAAIEAGQTSVIDGWGIHFIPFRGWTFNLWGFECVEISMGNKTIRIGTDDSANLLRFLNTRLRGED